jgi:hypothetical protein
MTTPIIKTASYVGIGAPQRIRLGFKPDLLFIKGASQYASFQHDYTWAGGREAFGNTTLTGSDGTLCYFTDDGFTLKADASNNAAGVTYHYLAIKDNESGILQTGNYNGYRYQTVAANGANSDPVTLDILKAKPDAFFVKRDSATRPAVFANSSFVKKDGAYAPDPTLLTVNADGTLSLSTDISVNENNAFDSGEAHNFFALFNNGNSWYTTSYVGTGAALNVPVPITPAAAIVIPQASGSMIFNWGTMGANSADGGNTALVANKIKGFSAGNISIGTDASVNTLGVTYTVLCFAASSPQQISASKIAQRTALRMRNQSGVISRVACGSDNSLGVAGAITLEWIGEFSGNVSEHVLMSRGGGASTGSRSTPANGSFNYAMAYTDSANGLEVCTSDQFSNVAPSPSVTAFNRWRTGWKPQLGRRYHLMFTHDGIDKWLMYVDGKLVNWRRFPQSVIGLNGITNTAGLFMGFGARYANGAWYASQNTLHALGRIYNRMLSTSEVLQRYQLGFLGQSVPDIASGLVEEWGFTEATGSTVAATINSVNNGTITNGAWVKP